MANDAEGIGSAPAGLMRRVLLALGLLVIAGCALLVYWALRPAVIVSDAQTVLNAATPRDRPIVEAYLHCQHAGSDEASCEQAALRAGEALGRETGDSLALVQHLRQMSQPPPKPYVRQDDQPARQ